ncbi:delta(14)-sterol reductase LBR-like [Schistocerca americana]|uniref:delta(14)-sterol reductase LBR-like n=1 Tax=Schistocerca americana TaxID=7009 RepID=UPI001F503CD0|nr:delta(14)-sterol reductase LBR-like [Schistocerca americana]
MFWWVRGEVMMRAVRFNEMVMGIEHVEIRYINNPVIKISDVPRYGKSYFEGDFQRRLSKEGSVDVPRYGKSYFEGDFQRRLSKEGSVDVPRYGKSYFEGDFQRRLSKEGSVDVPRYGKSYFEGDFQRRLSKEGSVDVPRYGKSYFEGDFQRRLSKEGSVDVPRYGKSYFEGDFQRRLAKEGSVDVPRYGKSYFEGDFQRRLSKEGSVDVPRYGKSYFEGDFQRRLSKEGSVGLADLHPSAIRGSDNLLNERGKVTPGSADLRPSAIRGSGSLLKERGKVTADLTRHTASNVDRGLQRQLVKEGSADSTLATKYVKDNEKKYLNKYPMEFGGRLGTLLLILFLPLYVLSLFSFNLVPDPTKFEVLFQMQLVLIPQVAVGIIMLIIFQALLSIVPIGKVVSGPLTKLGILKMRCNGIFAALFALVLISSVCYFKREVADIVVSVYSEAAVSAMLVGIVFSLILYRRGGKLPISYLNPYGSKGFMWYDFWMGREVTPRIGKFNVKLILHRFSIIIVIALNMLIAIKAYLQGVEEEILRSVIISTILQSLYSLHFIFHEDLYLYSFLAISEGVGYMIAVGLMTFPFILTFTTKAILDYRLKASLTEMYIVLCSYTIGQILLQSSSHRKMLSLKNPVTSVWRVNVLPKWSAAVQIRAYMGEIIIYWALALVAVLQTITGVPAAYITYDNALMGKPDVAAIFDRENSCCFSKEVPL